MNESESTRNEDSPSEAHPRRGRGIIRNVARDHVAERPRPTVAVEELATSSIVVVGHI